MNLLSTIGAIIVVIIMIPYMIGWWETGNSAVQQRIIANHMTMVMRAANQYVNQHQDTLLSQATATTGPTISIADLRECPAYTLLYQFSPKDTGQSKVK